MPAALLFKRTSLIVRLVGRPPVGRLLVDRRPAGHRLAGRHPADRRPVDRHLVDCLRGALSRDLVVRLAVQRQSVSVGLDLVVCS